MKVPRNFKERQEFYNQRKNPQHSWRQCYNHIFAALQLLSHYHCKTIVELGCNDGALAVKCLENLSWKPLWAGYDISEHFIEGSLKHPQYHAVLLNKQIWETDIGKFDIFVSSHTIEHLFPDEIVSLVEWLSQKARFLVFCLPGAWSWSKVVDTHVNPHGTHWLRNLLLSLGFRVVWHTASYFGWYAHYKEPMFR